MGWTFNADPDAVTGAGLIVGVGVFFALVSFSAVSLRLYVRAKLVKNVNIGESWTISWVAIWLTTSPQMTGLSLVPGYGRLRYGELPSDFEQFTSFLFMSITLDREFPVPSR